MANLGDNNTPVEGESFGLPSGFSIDEENGDLVIRDTDGTVAMRRADGTWELESDLALNENGISGVGAFDSESVNTETLGRGEGNLSEAGGSWSGLSLSIDGDPDDTSSTEFQQIATIQEGFPGSQQPDGASLYVNLAVRSDTVPDGEAGAYRLFGIGRNASDVDFFSLPETEVEVTEDGERNGTGWVEITSINPTAYEIFTIERLSAKVTGGTLQSNVAANFHIAAEWRIN